MSEPRMFYFGPWSSPGHFVFCEDGRTADEVARGIIPWHPGQMDGPLQPHTDSYEQEGLALIHHRDGWTALAFWDRSIDTRHGCNSTYLAKGDFTFTEMVEMAKERFAERWNKMKFEVTDVTPPTPDSGGEAEVCGECKHAESDHQNTGNEIICNGGNGECECPYYRAAYKVGETEA